jgi:hypothetical protein
VYNFDGCLAVVCSFAKLGVLSFTFVMRRLIGLSKFATNAYEVCLVVLQLDRQSPEVQVLHDLFKIPVNSNCAIASVNYAF